MDKIKVMVDWCGKNYAAYICDDRIGGMILSTGKSLKELKQDTEESVRFHIEGCLLDGDPIPESFQKGDYELEYEKRNILNTIVSKS